MTRQQLANQQGEIDFRRKLSRQQIEGERLLEDEFDAGEINRILLARMDKTRLQMAELVRSGVAASPYVEIGAERCQRALVLENDLGLAGAAVDLSFDMLKSCRHYQGVFGKERAPLRLCCDANNLPFLSDSLPFVFCYETLHHFPDPEPIVREIHRVLGPGGWFHFDEEPFRQVLHLDLYEGRRIYSEETLGRHKLRRILDYFLCRRTCNEVEHGILENRDIALRSWKRALGCFATREVQLHAVAGIHAGLEPRRRLLSLAAAWLLGGRITARCRKAGSAGPRPARVEDALACPDCREQGRDHPLRRDAAGFVCDGCRAVHPVVDDVALLLSRGALSRLYPEHVRG